MGLKAQNALFHFNRVLRSGDWDGHWEKRLKNKRFFSKEMAFALLNSLKENTNKTAFNHRLWDRDNRVNRFKGRIMKALAKKDLTSKQLMKQIKASLHYFRITTEAMLAEGLISRVSLVNKNHRCFLYSLKKGV